MRAHGRWATAAVVHNLFSGVHASSGAHLRTTRSLFLHSSILTRTASFLITLPRLLNSLPRTFTFTSCVSRLALRLYGDAFQHAMPVLCLFATSLHTRHFAGLTPAAARHPFHMNMPRTPGRASGAPFPPHAGGLVLCHYPVRLSTLFWNILRCGWCRGRRSLRGWFYWTPRLRTTAYTPATATTFWQTLPAIVLRWPSPLPFSHRTTATATGRTEEEGREGEGHTPHLPQPQPHLPAPSSCHPKLPFNICGENRRLVMVLKRGAATALFPAATTGRRCTNLVQRRDLAKMADFRRSTAALDAAFCADILPVGPAPLPLYHGARPHHRAKPVPSPAVRAADNRGAFPLYRIAANFRAVGARAAHTRAAYKGSDSCPRTAA